MEATETSWATSIGCVNTCALAFEYMLNIVKAPSQPCLWSCHHTHLLTAHNHRDTIVLDVWNEPQTTAINALFSSNSVWLFCQKWSVVLTIVFRKGQKQLLKQVCLWSQHSVLPFPSYSSVVWIVGHTLEGHVQAEHGYGDIFFFIIYNM